MIFPAAPAAIMNLIAALGQNAGMALPLELSQGLRKFLPDPLEGPTNQALYAADEPNCDTEWIDGERSVDVPAPPPFCFFFRSRRGFPFSDERAPFLPPFPSSVGMCIYGADPTGAMACHNCIEAGLEDIDPEEDFCTQLEEDVSSDSCRRPAAR